MGMPCERLRHALDSVNKPYLEIRVLRFHAIKTVVGRKIPAFFRQAQLHPELYTAIWPNGADFAPEFLYEHLTVRGLAGLSYL